MKHRWMYGCVIGLWLCHLAYAQAPQIDNYSGDFWSRPALTGDWGGPRSQFHYVIDILPIVLEAAGLPEPVTVNGVDQ